MIQVNTSGEETKYGVAPEDVVPLAAHIHTQCAQLRLGGTYHNALPLFLQLLYLDLLSELEFNMKCLFASVAKFVLRILFLEICSLKS